MGKKQWLILFLMMASAIFFWNVNCYAAEESDDSFKISII